jgi:cytochrome o ubiquinol oxidase subunit 3
MSTDIIPVRYAASEVVSHAAHEDKLMFGFWLYILSDCILFSGLFATYAVIGRNTAGGPGASELFDLRYALTETMLLLFSSISYGVAMIAMNARQRRQTLFWLAVTALLGLGFIMMEFHEFHEMILAGSGPQRSGFLSAFFTLVGTHGAHVTVGLIWMVVMMVQVARKGLNAPVRSRLMRLSVFWHFLDIVWIGVFSVVYLMGVAT